MSDLILVTGASGFIGQAVVEALLRSGHHVRTLTRSVDPSAATHPLLERATGDVRDLPSLERAMAGVRAVVHLAAMKNDEPESGEVNIGGAKNLIEACRIAGVKRIVNVSTQSAKLTKAGVYGRSTAEADRLFHASSIPTVTLRSSLVYGDASSGVFGTIVRYSALPSG